MIDTKIKHIIKNNFFWTTVFIISFIFFGRGEYLQAQNSTGINTNSQDAIAVRIIPNPNHYSIAKWYQSQGFRGSPQALTVDGYEAIRDGRTVYVNAANIDQANKTIYTNIYLISYNQDYANTTADILGQLVSRWKFNSNLVESTSSAPTCSISALSCGSDLDCGSGQSCSTEGSSAGSCVLNVAKNCLVDTDCPNSFFCNSLKSQIIRDVKRVGRLEEFKEALGSFRQTNGRYPLLSAGTYLAGHSISVWPSWPQVLLSDLALSPNLRDPINRLGPCVAASGSTGTGSGGNVGHVQERGLGNNNPGDDPDEAVMGDDSPELINGDLPDNNGDLPDNTNPGNGNGTPAATGPAVGYDPITCWNPSTRRFINNPSNMRIVLPAYSHAFVYSTNQSGSIYNMCATMESRTLNYVFSPSYPSSAACDIAAAGQAFNNPPRLLEYVLVGEPGKAFNGYIRVTDDDGDPLSWSWTATSGHSNFSWNGWLSGGVANQPPLILNTSNPYQKKIYAERAGDNPGVYNLSLRLNDGRNGILTTSTPITLSASPIFIEAANEDYIVHPTAEFVYRFNFSSANLNNPGLASAVVSRISGPYDILADFNRSFAVIGNNKYQVEYRGLIPATRQFYNDTIFNYRIRVTDRFGSVADKNFNITIKNPGPALNFSCLNEVRIGKQYQCFLGEKIQSGQTINFTASGAPNGLSIIDPTSPETRVSLSGAPTNLSTGQNITIKGANAYGASTTRVTTLRINSYCGDGVKQSPNTEGRGGLFNNGYEDCDGTSGTTSVVANSSVNLQYGCRTNDSNTPYPILSNSYCIYQPPVRNDGSDNLGGYCGDGYCQLQVRGQNMESPCNCEADCGKGSNCCVPNCNGKTCGSDGCGGFCGQLNGACSANYSCSSGQCVANSFLSCTSNSNCQAGLEVCNCWTGKASRKTLTGVCSLSSGECLGNTAINNVTATGPGEQCDPNGPLGDTWTWRACSEPNLN